MEDMGLLKEVLPEICSINGLLRDGHSFDALKALDLKTFEPSLSLLLKPLYETSQSDSRQRVEQVKAVCRRLRMSNEENDCVCWLLDSLPLLENIARRPLHVLKPLLAHPHAELLLDLSAAIAASENTKPEDVEFCRRYLSSHSAETLVPAPLIDGRDVLEQGIPSGPLVRDLLRSIHNEQLDEKLQTRDQALVRLKELIQQQH
jgi:poly(A) polymerase